MKKNYETPAVEVVKFQYRDQVVVASAGKGCDLTREIGQEEGKCYGGVVKLQQ